MTDPVIVQFEVSMSQLVKVVSEALTDPLASAEIYAAVNKSAATNINSCLSVVVFLFVCC